MNKADVISRVLGDKHKILPRNPTGKAFAPSNIALCKYWGKRNQELNLPVTSSLSISLGNKGTDTDIAICSDGFDHVIVNDQIIQPDSTFGKRLQHFLDLFRAAPDLFFKINVKTNIPIGAGLASSASGFASLVQSLNALFGWELSANQLSILSRLGSGSAARSIWQGFVEWHVGLHANGMDSHGESIATQWPEVCVGLVIVSDTEKKISSREAMQRTVATSPLYAAWPAKVAADLVLLKQAIQQQDFALLGKTAEWNALAMHATMLSAWPAVTYALPETVVMMEKIWRLRAEGLPVYFTQDAGPNLKLLFLGKDVGDIKKYFPQVEIIKPFYPLQRT